MARGVVVVEDEQAVTQLGLALLGVSGVFWVANWISIDAGKGWQPMCTIIGCMLFGAGVMALMIAGGKVRR